MSRLRFKGGAWTNSEDEVLRASLTVYGLQNWERVASMLVRKTAAQCRERWENFLDPRLHIHEAWTASEEEWLVQLQSLFANQWNLIARELRHRCKMNRPAWLCEEHYHSLLDALEYERQQRDGGGKNKNESLTLEDFLAERKRHRSVHQGYETRAARPDTVNPDVFEKEMVEFAVSRLANQDGKKGLRKERKKQLEHTSFLAKLQSNREAIESGTLSAKAKKRMERAMLEDIKGPSDTKLQDNTVEDDSYSGGDNVSSDVVRGDNEKNKFQPIDLGADRREAGIQAKRRVLVKDLSADKARLLESAVEPEGVDIKELLQLAGSAPTASSNLLKDKKSKLLTNNDNLSGKNKENIATNLSRNEVDFDHLFASLPDIIVPASKSTENATEAVDMFKESPQPMYGEEAQKNDLFTSAVEHYNHDSDDYYDNNEYLAGNTISAPVDKSSALAREEIFGKDFDGVKWDTWMLEARRRVSVEAERAFFSRNSSTCHLLDLNGNLTKQEKSKEQEIVNNEEEENEDKDEECISRLVKALVAQQLPSAARSLLQEDAPLEGPTKKKMRLNDGCNNNNNGNTEGEENEKYKDYLSFCSELATRVAATQQENCHEYWKSVGATEAIMQLEELLKKQHEEIAVLTARETADKKNVERIVRICFLGGQPLMYGDDVIRRACVHWGAQLLNAQRRLAMYSSIRESELKEIQRRLDDATSRLVDAEKKERLLQEKYRSMRFA